MTNVMKHKGYIGMFNVDTEAGILYGEVINIRDVITFQGETVEEVKKSFIDSVEDYLDFCKERGEDPEKPFSGSFVLRLSPETHQQAYIRAKQLGVSLNEWVKRTIEKELG
jgi:predicted HicB family RNase H-like nuclease